MQGGKPERGSAQNGIIGVYKALLEQRHNIIIIHKESYPAANSFKVTLRDSLSKEVKELSLGSAMV